MQILLNKFYFTKILSNQKLKLQQFELNNINQYFFFHY
mgnify:CR=1 FL=1